MKRQVIGLTGFARAGKDSFCNIASELIEEEYGLKCKRYALADALKDDIKDFIEEKVGLNVYSDDPVVKSVFRPLLVAYGKCKRIQSEATYWTSLLQKKIESDTESDIIFVTDVRYAEYKHDEIQWLLNTMNGKLIHISKYEIDEDGDKIYVEPPNEDEAKNDPVIREYSNILFEWEHCLKEDGNVDKEYMKSVVRPIIASVISNDKSV